MQAEAYNEAIIAVNKKIEEAERTIHVIQVGLEKKSANYAINKELIIEAMQNFEVMFEIADNEEKKQLIRALVKRIEVEPDRKSLKSIVFWFSEDNALPLNDTRRTIPQVKTQSLEVFANSALIVSEENSKKSITYKSIVLPTKQC